VRFTPACTLTGCPYVLQGKEPWNKGRSMTVETRAKMAAAKSGLSLRKGVRAKMSRAHVGKTHTEVCCGLFEASEDAFRFSSVLTDTYSRNWTQTVV